MPRSPEVLIAPLITEKMSRMSDAGKYAFRVATGSNKIEIKRAIERRFKVSVTDVNTVLHKGKARTQLTRRGRFSGRTAGWKRAIVTLKKGDAIDFFAEAPTAQVAEE
jgi:large subunit ribosomal protein L23